MSESPYAFTARDVASTVEIAGVLLDLYPGAAQAELSELAPPSRKRRHQSAVRHRDRTGFDYNRR